LLNGSFNESTEPSSWVLRRKFELAAHDSCYRPINRSLEFVVQLDRVGVEEW
jgi:hypothetical protein